MSSADARYRVERTRTRLGEWFPILVDATTGIPCTLALRYALSRRQVDDAQEIHDALRALAWLYEWYDVRHPGAPEYSLEAELRSPMFVQNEDLTQAMRYADAGVHGVLPVVDLAQLVTTLTIERPGSHNKRMVAWQRFLKWAVVPNNWRSGRRLRDTVDERIARASIEADLEAFFSEARRFGKTYGRRRGYSIHEDELLKELVYPVIEDDDTLSWDTFDIGFQRGPRPLWAERHRLRNYLFYAFQRELGLRRSEVLKLRVEDLPRREVDPVTGAVSYTLDRRLQIVRREDDPDDPRPWEPKVKRVDRTVRVRDELLDHTELYLTAPPPVGRNAPHLTNPYLFLTDHGVPLSIGGTGDMKKKIRAWACALWDQRHGGRGHSLSRFMWHRLRHTCAMELLPEYRAIHGEEWERFFLEDFGWAQRESAQPYITDALHREGQQRLAQHEARMTEAHTMRVREDAHA